MSARNPPAETKQVAQVDLTLIHTNQCGWGSGGGGGASVAETWRALEDALAAGKTKSIGVSHFAQKDIKKLMETAKIKPVSRRHAAATNGLNVSSTIVMPLVDDDLFVEGWSAYGYEASKVSANGIYLGQSC